MLLNDLNYNCSVWGGWRLDFRDGELLFHTAINWTGIPLDQMREVFRNTLDWNLLQFERDVDQVFSQGTAG